MTKRKSQQFIPGDGIDERVFCSYIASRYGHDIDWRAAVDVADGREGYIVKDLAPIEPEVLHRLQRESRQLREAEKEQYHRKYVDKLHESWFKHRQYLQHETHLQEVNVNRVSTYMLDRNLPVPFLDIPPTYDETEGLESHRRSVQLPPVIRTDTNQGHGLRRRPVSCSDLDSFSPSGCFYPDGYSRSKAGLEEGLTFSRVYGPPGLPECTPTQNSQGSRGLSPQTRRQSAHPFYQPWQGQSSRAETCNLSTRSAPLGRARSTTSLNSSHYGLAYRPSQHLSVPGPGDELFFGTPGSLDGNGQQMPSHGRNHAQYADGRPSWA